ncbi:MSHA biogenesis protein MshQ [hydrothermal vent metagenome]|uniref:MSHA biogenesis protein MshQ n=1 Tax=hydrothermal vent metagenome TaxID=652676 RepID=A0A3B1BCP5_9ZZZZ
MLALLLTNTATLAGTYIDSVETFSWIDPASHTDVIWTRASGSNECSGPSATTDDDITQELSLGFTFNFGGVNYTTVRIMSNGRLQFNNTYCGYGTQSTSTPRTYPYPMPDTRLVRTLRGYGGDLDPSAGGTVRYAMLGSAPNRYFVATFSAVPEWSAGGSSFDVQVILYESGEFVYQFGSISNPTQGHPQIGWEVSTDDYQLYDYNTMTDLANTAFRFSSHSPSPQTYYNMDELIWDGTANEILDGSGNNNHGNQVGAADTTTPGYLCRAGDFNTNNDALDSQLNVRDGIGVKGTMTFWYNSSANWSSSNRMLFDGSRNAGGSGSDKYFFLVKRTNGRLRFVLEDSNDADLVVQTGDNNFASGSWHHVAVTWDISNDADWLQIYVDGSRQATNRGDRNGPLNITGLLGSLNSLYFGDNRTNGVGGSYYSSNPAGGLLDETRIYTEALSASQINDDMNLTHGCLLANWYMDEAAWNGTASEVVDRAGHGYHGTGINSVTTGGSSISEWAIASNPGTCRYGNFDGSDDYVALSGFPNLTDSFTITAWIKPDAINYDQRIFVDDENNSGGFAFSLGDPGDGRLRFFSRNVNPISLDSSAAITTGTWYFVTAVHDASARTRQIYVNASAVTSASSYTGSWGSDNGTASIGGETDAAGSEAVANWRFDGNIDEVRVYDKALSQAEIATIMAETHACTIISTLDHIEIQHDGSALTCEPESITLRTCADASCSTLYTGDVSVTLSPTGWIGGDTQTITGGTSILQLRHTTVETVTLDVSSSSPSENFATSCLNTSDSSSSCSLAFYDSGFIYSIPTQISCEKSASITVSAVRKDDASQQCVPTFANRNETINFWTQYESPGTGTNVLTLDNGTNDYPLATDPPGTGVLLSFDGNGQATINVTYPDAGRLSLHSQFDGSGSEAGLVMAGSTMWVTKPAMLHVTTTPSCNSDYGNCNTFAVAGSGFALTVSAACADYTVTPNFVHDTISLTHSIVDPAGSNGLLGINGTSIASGGEVTINNQSISEVGVFKIKAALGSNYLEEAVIGDDTVNTSEGIGRFYPSYFTVSRVQSCDIDNFTYSDHPFITVGVKVFNSLGAQINNYISVFVRSPSISDNGTSGGSFSNNTFDSSNFTIPIGSGDNGTLAGVAYTFDNKNTVSTDIPLLVTDTDGVNGSAPVINVYSGRLNIENAFGSELDDLAVPVTVQYFNGNSYVTNALDSNCSTISLSLSDPDATDSLTAGTGGSAGQTCLWDDDAESGSNNCSASSILPGPVSEQFAEPPVAGNFNSWLKAPGAGNTGNMDITGTAPVWLQYDWNGGGLIDPGGRASFGLFRGDDRIIYWREQF